MTASAYCRLLIHMTDPSELDPRRVVAAGYDRIADRYASWVLKNPVDTSAASYLGNRGQPAEPVRPDRAGVPAAGAIPTW